MGIFDQEMILPGVITDIISDYSSGYDTSKFGTTDSVTIIGTAFDGPVGKPTKVYSPEHAKYIFGKTFDSATKREATLVAEIQDAWDRGCRTIYAIRLSGKEIYKDYQLATRKGYKLRVSGIFPSNKNKEVYFQYIPEKNNAKASIKFFKPAARATIEEKMMGKVINDESVITNTVLIGDSWNISEDNRLVDFIDLFNSYKYNNVISLSVVNENGEDISQTLEGQSILVGDLLPGIYFVGRNKNGKDVVAKTETITKLSKDDNSIFISLQCNTDVTKDLPIYGAGFPNIENGFGTFVSTATIYDFLQNLEKVNETWLKDNIDYEEVSLDNFEVYKKLGSGFATTCKIVETREGSGVYKVVEVTDKDSNKIVAINDGIYSMLENLSSNYRVLTGKYADTEIKSSLPKKSEFLIPTPKSADIFSSSAGPVIKATPKLDKEEATKSAKKYVFELENILETADFYSKEKVLEQLYCEEDGTLIAYAFPLEETVQEAFTSELQTKKYILLDVDGEVVVYGKDEVGTGVKPLVSLEEVLNEDTELFVTFSPDEDKTKITLKIANLDILTMDTFVSLLNEKDSLSKLFSFSLTGSNIIENSDKKVKDVIEFTLETAKSSEVVDREDPAYDTSLYIPFKTTDNFLRQLAQHCIYCGFKSSTTHGIIGCGKMTTGNLNTIASRINELVNTDFNLYAKKSNGNNMLDKNNLPYPIGRAVSCTFFQHPVETDDNYTYVATGAAAYAGMVSCLSIDQSSTAQTINLDSVSYDLTNYQLARLTQAGFVTVKDSYTKGYVITDGVTMAPSDSPFRRLSVTRILNGIDEAIRVAAEPFIGKQNHLANRNSLQTSIKSSLDAMLNNLIERYDFKLVTDKSYERMGIIEIEYTIVPIYEIREIRNRITVKDSE